MEQLYEEWAMRFVREQEEWQTATTARIEARLASAAFVSAFADGDATLDVDHLRPKGDPIVRNAAADGAKQAARFAAKAPRETVTEIAHAFGHKFRPWGATKLTAKVNVAGGAFGLAFGALELYSTWNSAQKEGDAERTARERRGASLQQVREAAENYFDSTEPDAPGTPMAESLNQVQQARDTERGRLDDTEAEAATLSQQIDRCKQRMQDALEQLETPES
ncbi:hypothetical protein ACE2AJ_00465 [Aquihabitans daechungensis]|uniref:hypothetical protein n=1 Tax=Aquihabitans daechungensis TaxID=1052257 RepID=UPI003BA1EAF4